MAVMEAMRPDGWNVTCGRPPTELNANAAVHLWWYTPGQDEGFDMTNMTADSSRHRVVVSDEDLNDLPKVAASLDWVAVVYTEPNELVTYQRQPDGSLDRVGAEPFSIPSFTTPQQAARGFAQYLSLAIDDDKLYVSGLLAPGIDVSSYAPAVQVYLLTDIGPQLENQGSPLNTDIPRPDNSGYLGPVQPGGSAAFSRRA